MNIFKYTIAAIFLGSSLLFSAALNDVVQTKKLQIKTALKGMDSSITFSDNTTIAQLKELIRESEGISVDQQFLFKKESVKFLGFTWKEVVVELEDNKTCGQYDLKNNDTIDLLIRLRVR